MNAWHVIWTMKRGTLPEPELIDAISSGRAETSMMAEKKEPSSVCAAYAMKLEAERAKNGWWRA
jgi:hypothetical protein